MGLLINSIISIIVLLVVYSAALVTYHAVRSDYFEHKQKTVIIAIAWLIPIIGPAFILAILNQDKPRVRKPGIPLIDFIFLAAVFTQINESRNEDSHNVVHDISDFGGGDNGGGSSD